MSATYLKDQVLNTHISLQQLNVNIKQSCSHFIISDYIYLNHTFLQTTEVDANLLDETSSNESDEDPFQETHLGAENLLKQTKTSKETEKFPLIGLKSNENEHMSDEELLNL